MKRQEALKSEIPNVMRIGVGGNWAAKVSTLTRRRPDRAVAA